MSMNTVTKQETYKVIIEFMNTVSKLETISSECTELPRDICVITFVLHTFHYSLTVADSLNLLR